MLCLFVQFLNLLLVLGHVFWSGTRRNSCRGRLALARESARLVHDICALGVEPFRFCLSCIRNRGIVVLCLVDLEGSLTKGAVVLLRLKDPRK